MHQIKATQEEFETSLQVNANSNRLNDEEKSPTSANIANNKMSQICKKKYNKMNLLRTLRLFIAEWYCGKQTSN